MKKSSLSFLINPIYQTSKEENVKQKTPGENNKFIFIGIAYLFIAVFIFLPMLNLFFNAFEKGLIFFWNSISHKDTISALLLNLTVVLFTIPLNLVFGILVSICITRFEFRGKTLLLTLVDIPFSVSPVISGLIFILIFGLGGWLGERIESLGFQIIFATPGIIIATIFITFPFIAREIIPVMSAGGEEEEQAAFILGANSIQNFYYVTFPKIKWGVLYGVILCNARVMGEYGAVSIVSGHITGLTDTLPLRVEKLYSEYQTVAAFSVAVILAILAFLTLLIKTYIEWKRNQVLEEWK
ncbi:MAG: sulfate ABC transporter permease subunit CysW [Leptospiraceae bacterium]|nr:sulfate ABC transporter permease subunit CysW [Leptospiraceae bacterium]